MQAAMDASNPGDQIWVAKGTYTDSVTLEDSRKLLGSFAGNETDPSQRNMTANPTVLVQSDDLSMYVPPDCGTATTVDGFVFDSVGTAAAPLENADIECWGSPTFSNCLLTGAQYSYYAPLRVIEGNPSFKSCTFSGNHISLVNYSGYQMYIVEVWSSASFYQCKFANNLSNGIYVRGSSSFTLCSITGNTGPFFINGEGGGTILLLSCTANSNNNVVQSINSPITVKASTFSGNGRTLYSTIANMDVENCQFTNNVGTSIKCGGHLFLTDSLFTRNQSGDGAGAVTGAGTIQRCVFTGNYSDGYGGAISTGTVSASQRCFVKDCLFVANNCYYQGSAIDLGGYVTVANCTFAGNLGGTNGSAGTICVEPDNLPSATTAVVVANNVIFGNAGGVASPYNYPVVLDHNLLYGDAQFEYSGCSPGSTDIHVDPKFFNPANGDCHLGTGSPAIGAGAVAYIVDGDKDLDGLKRLTTKPVSLGCYEPLPISITGLTISSPVVGGFSTPATVSLSAPAYYGLVVAFTESNTSGAISLPYPVGSSSATIEVPTQPVVKDTTITVTVVYGSTSKSASLLIKAPGLQSLQLPNVGVIGGNSGTGILHFSGPDPAAGSVSLSSSSPALAVPATVAGSGTNAPSFIFTTIGVATAQTVTVTATFNGVQVHSAIAVLPANLNVMLVSAKTVKGGGRVAGYAYLDGLAPPNGAVISLSSDNPAITVPSSVTIKGSNNASYLIQSAVVTKTTVVHVTGTYRGVQVSVAVEVDP
jgi:predicted outer membrane repeat protein